MSDFHSGVICIHFSATVSLPSSSSMYLIVLYIIPIVDARTRISLILQWNLSYADLCLSACHPRYDHNLALFLISYILHLFMQPPPLMWTATTITDFQTSNMWPILTHKKNSFKKDIWKTISSLYSLYTFSQFVTTKIGFKQLCSEPDTADIAAPDLEEGVTDETQDLIDVPFADFINFESDQLV